MTYPASRFMDTLVADDEWMAEHQLLSRVAERAGDIARNIVDIYRREILDYRSLNHTTIAEDVLPNATLTLQDLLRRLQTRGEPTMQELDDIRRAASRRVHQEVSLPALLHTYRIWGRVVWHEIAVEAQKDSTLRDAALRLAEPVMDYVNQVSMAVAQVYLEESAGLLRGRDMLRSDILESMLRGRPLSDRARLDINRMHISDETHLLVVLIRLLDVPADRIRPDATKAVRALRENTRAMAILGMGIRDSDVVAICRVGDGVGARDIEAAADGVAILDTNWRVALGRPHKGLPGLPAAFKEAQNAVAIASAKGRHGKATAFGDVMLDQILVSSEYAQDLLDQTLRPLVEYDCSHSAELVETVRQFLAANLNLTRTATAMTLNANTVSYRLKRVEDLTGHNPTTSHGVTTFALALRLLDS